MSRLVLPEEEICFAWLAEDALMTMRSKMRRLIPSSVAVLGADDVLDQLTMLYSDDRGVTRTYAMELARTRLTFHRKAPRFHQRFAMSPREYRNSARRRAAG